MLKKNAGATAGWAIVATMSACSGAALGATETDPLTAAITRGKVDVDYRLRGEWVDQDGHCRGSGRLYRPTAAGL